MENNLKLSSPWVNLYHEYEAMFGEDEDIKLVINDEEKEIRLYVNGQDKADALCVLLPDKYEFGNITVMVEVIPSNEKLNKAQLFKKAFAGNPVHDYIETVEGIFNNPITYVVFKKEVCQYFNDNLGDINGNVSTLYENIAGDIFDHIEGVLFCTNNE